MSRAYTHRPPSSLPEYRIDGRIYNLTESQKAASLGISGSFLQKDRLREVPKVDFARFGGLVRYSADQ
jgi:hypothetical protein